MKKTLALVAVGCLTASTSFATISIQWDSFAAATDPVDSMGVDDGSLVQLIWSPTGTIGAIDPGNPTVPTGDNVLLDSALTQFDGFVVEATSSYMGENFGQGADGLVPGFVFTRIFNVAAPGVGDWYDEGGLVGGPLTDQDPTPGTANLSNVADGGAFTLSQQIPAVPEPATWAFMGVGVLSMLAWRRRR